MGTNKNIADEKKFTLDDMCDVLGEEILKIHTASKIDKDEKNRIDGVASLSKQFIQSAHIEAMIEKMMIEHKDQEFAVSKLVGNR